MLFRRTAALVSPAELQAASPLTTDAQSDNWFVVVVITVWMKENSCSMKWLQPYWNTVLTKQQTPKVNELIQKACGFRGSWMQKCSSEDGEEFFLTEISSPQIFFPSKRNLSHGNKNGSKTDNCGSHRISVLSNLETSSLWSGIPSCLRSSGYMKSFPKNLLTPAVPRRLLFYGHVIAERWSGSVLDWRNKNEYLERGVLSLATVKNLEKILLFSFLPNLYFLQAISTLHVLSNK